MKKVILLLFTLITSVTNAQVMYSDNMENVGWTWKGTPLIASRTNLPFTRYVGGLTSIADLPAYTPQYSSSDTCWIVSGVGPGSSLGIEKDTMVYSNVTGLNPNDCYRISFKLASIGLNVPTNTAAGVDAADFVQIDWSDDGGLTYKTELKISGFSNSTWGFNSPSGTQLTKTSTGLVSTYTSSTLSPITTVNLDLPLNTNQLTFRIILAVNSAGESWCIDDVNLSLRTILPIELLSFKAKVKNNVIALDWTTISESNNNHFILSKSKDAFIYSDIGTVSGGGNSSETKTYQFIDEFPYDGLNYYKLSQVDDNGQVQTFDPICVKYINTENKTITKIINVAGQEVDERYNGVKIYCFDDNTVMVSDE
jgi:hypothetical protein